MIAIGSLTANAVSATKGNSPILNLEADLTGAITSFGTSNRFNG